MLAGVYVVGFVAALWLGLVHLHWSLHGVVNSLQVGLSLFVAVNVLICLWELSLFFHAERIRQGYQGKLKKLERGQLGKVFLFQEVSLRDALSLRYWSEVWATYSLLDASYSDTGSFGWNIDVGNGFSSILPSFVFGFGMSLQDRMMSARLLGFIGTISFYQMLYGTVVYFFQFVVNQRWRVHGMRPLHLFFLVGCTNGFWIFFPLLGLYASYLLIMSDGPDPYSIFNV